MTPNDKTRDNSTRSLWRQGGPGFSSASDDWATPQEVFDSLDAEFHFTLDACASEGNAKCPRFFSAAQNGLVQEWAGVVWLNPPYGRHGGGIGAWMRKALKTARSDNGTVVCLVPARTDTAWWHESAMQADDIRLIQGRLKFGSSENAAPFPSAVVVFRRGARPPAAPRFSAVTAKNLYTARREVPALEQAAVRAPVRVVNNACARSAAAHPQRVPNDVRVRVPKPEPPTNSACGSGGPHPRPVTAQLLLGDCRERLREQPANSAHAIVTSPPYFSLRVYGDDKREIGAESQLDAYVDNLVEVFREARRVLHPSGVLFLNLGDSWAAKTVAVRNGGLKRKNQIGVPWRVVLALQAGFHRCTGCNKEMRSDLWPIWDGKVICFDCERAARKHAVRRSEDGWVLRMENIWQKSNGLPAGAPDRPTPCHENVFLLAKSQRYFYDAVAVREPCEGGSSGGCSRCECPRCRSRRRNAERPSRDRRSVWKMPTANYRGAHCAVMPLGLAEVCVRAGSSEHGCCPACGAPYERIVELGDKFDSAYLRSCGADETGGTRSSATKDFAAAGAQDGSKAKRSILAGRRVRTTSGWRPTCECDAGEPVPAVVLDPFMGSGTTGCAALQHGRSFVGIDLYRANLDQTRKRFEPFTNVENEEGETLGEEAA